MPLARRTIALTAAALGGSLAVLVPAGASLLGDDDPSPSDRTERPTGSTVTTTPTTAGDGALDISGPCDEAEHANDPRCTGVAPAPAPVPGDDDLDISGPCDEAEHANDPRCTGIGGATDNSGPGSVDGDDNSGPGGGDEDEDRSGPGGGDDDEDNSGPGSSSSGPGSGGDGGGD